MIRIFLISLLVFKSVASWGQNFGQFHQRINANDATTMASEGYSTAISGDGNTLVSGGYTDNNGIGAAWVYSFDGSNWLQMGSKLVGASAIGNASQGFAVDISSNGKVVALSGIADNDSTGAVWTFTLSGTSWVPLGNKISPPQSVLGTNGKIIFGYALSLSANGNRLAIGAPLANTSAGAAFVYSFTGTIWTIATDSIQINPTDLTGRSNFGNTLKLAADGKKLVACGLNDNNGNGACWVFTIAGATTTSGTSWKQVGTKIIPTDAQIPTLGGLNFGSALSATTELDKIIIGSKNDGNSIGAAWIFTFSGTTTATGKAWQQQGPKLVALDTVGFANQGASVALSANGNVVIVGGFTDNNYKGALWAYTHTGVGWQRIGKKITAADAGSFPFLGVSSSLNANGTRFVAGSFFEDFNEGGIRVFNLAAYTLTVTTFNQIRKVYEADPIFSYTVSGFVDGDTLANLIAVPTVTSNALLTSTGGNYYLRPLGAASLKYNFLYIDSVLVIENCCKPLLVSTQFLTKPLADKPLPLAEYQLLIYPLIM